MKEFENPADALAMYNTQSQNAGTIWLLFLFLGWSYGSLDKILLQILYYLTCGGFGLWWLIRIFTLNAAIRDYNRSIARRCKSFIVPLVAI